MELSNTSITARFKGVRKGENRLRSHGLNIRFDKNKKILPEDLEKAIREWVKENMDMVNKNKVTIRIFKPVVEIKDCFQLGSSKELDQYEFQL